MTKLTPAACRDLSPGQELYDHEVIGLTLRARATTKSWHLRYKPRGTRIMRKPKIGTFPSMSLSDARTAARELLLKVAQGLDPVAEWRASAAVPTVNELCDSYLKYYAPRRRGKKALKQHTQLIEAQIKPGLGPKLVTAVTTADVDSFLEKVFNREFVPADSRGETAHWTARHTRTCLRQLFNVAKSFFKVKFEPGWENPVDGSVVYSNRKRRRYAKKAEMARIAVQLDKLATEPGKRRPPDPLSAACIWTLFFTGARVSEIRLAEHEQLELAEVKEVDGKRQETWVLYLEKHKTVDHIGAKNVQMPKIAMDLLETHGLKRGLLFGDMKIRFLQKRWESVRDAADCPGLQLRDARRTFASFGLSAGYSLEQVGELLGHTDPQTTKGYAYMVEELKAAAADEIANAINKAARPEAA